MNGPTAADVLREVGGIAGVRQLRSAGVGWRTLAPDRLDPAIGRTPSGLVYPKGAGRLPVLAREWWGSVGCITAAEAYGLQVWKRPAAVHVTTMTSRSRPAGPEAPRTVVHRARQRYPLVVPLKVALLQVMRCLPELEALVVVESVVSRRRVALEDAGSRRRPACGDPRQGPPLRVGGL